MVGWGLGICSFCILKAIAKRKKLLRECGFDSLIKEEGERARERESESESDRVRERERERGKRVRETDSRDR
jgi:hypothetical protein